MFFGGFAMGFFGLIFGFVGFGIGISMGLLVGYFIFIYVQPSDVQVSLILQCISTLQHVPFSIASFWLLGKKGKREMSFGSQPS